MWTAQEFAEVLRKHPNGGTLWTRTHRMVRYIRVFRPDGKTVELFVRTPKGIEVAEFPNPQKTAEFSKSLLESSILLGLISPYLLDEVRTFIAIPDKTHLYTW